MINRFKRFLRFYAHVIRRRPFRGGWLIPYFRQKFAEPSETIPAGKMIDVMVCVVDHFEPGPHRDNVRAAQCAEAWCQDYASMVEGHADSDGIRPQHSWFYRFEYLNPLCVSSLSKFAFQGLGELEFHLHHGFDDHSSFTRKVQDGLALAEQFGAMVTAETAPQSRFAYIAGNWSLDNGSGDDSKSGCNTEIGALRDLGCFADFTFPAICSKAQPQKTNALYYATDCPKPKSYDDGVDVCVGQPADGDLMICQGPVTIDLGMPCIETAAIEEYDLPCPARLDRWLRANVHVSGRPEWKFIKLHTHGWQSREAWFDGKFKTMFKEMEARWKQPAYRLHYVTAREMYNIIKAAEAGHEGNPHDYRDFVIPKPANRWIHSQKPWKLLSFTENYVAIGLLESGWQEISFGFIQIKRISGDIRSIKLLTNNNQAVGLEIEAAGDVNITASNQLSFEPKCIGTGTTSKFCKVQVNVNELDTSTC